MAIDPYILAELNGQTVDPAIMDELNAPLSQDELTRQAADMAWSDTSAFDQFRIGMAKPFVQLGHTYGEYAPEWAGGFSDEESQEARLNRLRLEQAKSGYATAGQITTDLATLALPAGAILKGAKTLPMALAGESLLVGTYEGLKMPETNKSRLENATWGAGTTLGGGAVLHGLGKGVQALAKSRMTDEAKEMIERGIPLTPAMASKGSTAADLEQFASKIPFVRGGVQDMQDRAINAMNLDILNKVLPKGASVSQAGREGFQQAQHIYSKEYDNIWKQVHPENFKASTLNKEWGKLDGSILPAETATQAQSIINKSADDIASFMKTGDPRFLKSADDLMRDANPQDAITRDFFDDARDLLAEALPKKTGKQLKATNRQYAKFKTAEEAGAYLMAQMKDSIFTGNNLQSAIKKRSTPRQTTAGRGLLQPEADQIQRTISRVLPQRSQIDMTGDAANMATAAAAVTNPSKLAGVLAPAKLAFNEPVRNVMTGGAPSTMQQLWAEQLRRMGGTQSNNNKPPLR